MSEKKEEYIHVAWARINSRGDLYDLRLHKPISDDLVELYIKKPLTQDDNMVESKRS